MQRRSVDQKFNRTLYSPVAGSFPCHQAAPAFLLVPCPNVTLLINIQMYVSYFKPWEWEKSGQLRRGKGNPSIIWVSHLKFSIELNFRCIFLVFETLGLLYMGPCRLYTGPGGSFQKTVFTTSNPKPFLFGDGGVQIPWLAENLSIACLSLPGICKYRWATLHQRDAELFRE